MLLCYLGQSALILAHPHTISNPFYLLVPAGGRIAMVFLATIATIIASQAAITGSFSIARQAVQLGFLPRLKIKHTSELEGQIYVPLINFTLAIGVIALILIFQSSGALANIYGVAVTGTFVLDTILFLAVAHAIWHMAKWKLALVGVVFLTLELSFFTSNVSKVSHGAWIPLTLGLITAILMVTWRKGREIVTRNRTKEEGPLDDFLYQVRMSDPPIHRCRTVAIYLNPSKDTTPLALKADVEHHGIFHDKVVDRVRRAGQRAARRRGPETGRRDAREWPVQDPARHARAPATTTPRTFPRRWRWPANAGCSSATWTSSMPPISSLESRSRRRAPPA